MINMRGDMVIVRSYNGKPLVREVWDSDEQGVYITDDLQFRLLTTGRDGLEPIRFPREDVSKYDQQLVESGEKLDWSKLECW